MIAPTLITNAAMLAGADDTLVGLIEGVVARGYGIYLRREDGVWCAGVDRWPKCDRWSTGPTPADALRTAIAKLPKEAPHA